ncbi:hypothetical protein [Foetidibacter luteolus]|uniref:hypothetical protein n=1 Tax=Foetidibacter luteolus TaxID=2608880 RepID=UPI00129BFA5A|nr:hypothetical protein [Foetidibacter luteolus]
MRYLSIFLLAFFTTTSSYSQSENEFKVYPNGLIYSEGTMKQLAFIVDSLNIRFRQCNLYKTYYSKQQAQGYFISLGKKNAKQAKADIAQNISLEDFIKKYPSCTVKKDLLIIKSHYHDYEGKNIIEFRGLELGRDYDYVVRLEQEPKYYNSASVNSWVFKHNENSSYSDASLEAFYITDAFRTQPIPEIYARMIQYSDCMVDTSASIYKETAERAYRFEEAKDLPKVDRFLSYVDEETKDAEKYGGTKTDFWEKNRVIDSVRLTIIDTRLVKEEKFSLMLKEAVEEAIKKGGSSSQLELYAGRYLSKNVELELKRGYIVVGMCSQDESPRIRAMDIAVLSAETINWEIFLRAHLDIMNDRFERVSDGSYAWGARQTYIKELEDLDINVADLLLGITFRLENPSGNHYYGSISRLGRALAETKYSAEIENKMLNIIKDNSLDSYNRVLAYYLFLNYNYYVEDENRKKQNTLALANAVNSLPAFLSDKIREKERASALKNNQQ